MVCHCVQCGARAAAVSFPWVGILRPYAAFAWLTLGRDSADLALESDQVDEGEGKVPAHDAEKEDAIEECRERAATDAAESGNDEHHGVVYKDGPVKARSAKRKGKKIRVSLSPRIYMSSHPQRAVK